MNNKVMKVKLAEIDKSLSWARETTTNLKIDLRRLIDDLEKSRFEIVQKIGKKL